MNSQHSSGFFIAFGFLPFFPCFDTTFFRSFAQILFFMKEYLEITDKKQARTYIPSDYKITDWETLKPYFEYLVELEIESLDDLEKFLLQRNELDAIVSEEFAWRYIHMTCDTKSEEKKGAYQYFLTDILPHLSVYEDKLNRKVASSPWFDHLDQEYYQTFTRQLKREIEIFREENVPLTTQSQSISQEYGAIMGAMSIEYEGKELTLQQAGKYMEHHDRSIRYEVWKLMVARRKQDRQKLQDIFDKLVEIRHKIARNAGYDTYTLYKFDQMGRFDYQPEDTKAFHHAVETVVKPVYIELLKERQEKLGLEELRPWDLSVDIFSEEPLQPFSGSDELLNTSIEALSYLKPELGEMIRIMDRMGYLDLESRVGKAPGGYNYPLMEVGVPFIFMNAAGTQTDVITMLHESGHAVHSFLTRNIPIDPLKRTPSEVAELAAMSMELLCLDKYNLFYEDDSDLARAQKNQLLRCILIFPWIATVDAFQQWVYDNPAHDPETRNQKWEELHIRFHGDTINWEGYEDIRKHLWLKQGHIFDVPFYYIEYAIAQLGALAIWKNYRKDPKKGLNQYLEALKLGYTQPIPDIYSTAGIRFDFSEKYMKECVDFCLAEYHAI